MARCHSRHAASSKPNAVHVVHVTFLRERPGESLRVRGRRTARRRTNVLSRCLGGTKAWRRAYNQATPLVGLGATALRSFVNTRRGAETAHVGSGSNERKLGMHIDRMVRGVLLAGGLVLGCGGNQAQSAGP